MSFVALVKSIFISLKIYRIWPFFYSLGEASSE